jgi:hypothetical protein
VNLPFQLWHVSGLSNYSIPRPALSKRIDYLKSPWYYCRGPPPGDDRLRSIGFFLGSDMRAAYYGAGSLTGAGQNLGLFEYLGADFVDLREGGGSGPNDPSGIRRLADLGFDQQQLASGRSQCPYNRRHGLDDRHFAVRRLRAR